MWHLTRIHLDRIGAPAARFLDERLDFTDEFDRPLDSIVWLRNGGGKSTVLALLCAHLRPKRTDFLATSATGKHLEDYVQSGDTSHSILEWVNEHGQRLITGAVYEWDGHQAPEDPAKNHDRLTSTWYALTPADGTGSADLPRAGADGTPLRLKEYKAALRALPAERELVVCDDQARWGRTLDSHGMDPDLLTPILTMNATEGGIDGAFSYANPDGFIRYLLSLVADPASAANVAVTLEKVRRQLANRPKTVADLTFASEAEPQLRALADSYQAQQGAARALVLAQQDANKLARGFAARISATEGLTDQVADQVTEANERRIGARSARDLATFTAAELRRIGAVRRAQAAELQHDLSETARTSAREAVAALAGLDRVAAARQQELRVEEFALQLARQEVGAAPLADSRDATAATLYAVLTQELAELGERASRRQQRTLAAGGARDTARKDVADAGIQLGALTTTAKHLRKTIVAADAALAKARADGLLTEEQTPAAAHEHHARADDADRARIDVIDAALTEIETKQQTCREELIPARAKAAETATALTAAIQEQSALERAVAQLAADPAVNDLAQADQVDVLVEARELAAAAAAQVERHDRERMGHAVDTAEARRALAELEISQLLPPDIDLERALGALADAGIAATSGWRYLADNVPAQRHLEVLGAAPSLVAGVAVHDPGQLDEARQLLTSAQLRPITAIAVGTTADLHAAATGTSERTWLLPPAPALTDRAQAEQETELRALEVSEADQRDRALSAQRASTARLQAALSALADRYGPAAVQAIGDRLEEAYGNERAAQVTLTDLEGGEVALRVQERALALEHRHLGDRRRATSSELSRLAALVEAANAVQGAHAELAALPVLETAQRERQVIGKRAESDADGQLRNLEREQEEDEQARRVMTTQRDQLPQHARVPRPGADQPLPPLAAARGSYQQAAAAYDQATSGSELAATLRAARQVLEDYAKTVSALPAAVRAAAQALLDDGVDPLALPALTRDAASNEGRAETALVEAKTEVKLAADELRAASPEDRPRHRVLERPDPATRAQALAEAALEDLARDRALAAEKAAVADLERLGQQGKEHAQLISELTTLLLLLTTVPATDVALEGEIAFVGDFEAARAQAGATKVGLAAATAKDALARGVFDSDAKKIFLWANDPRFGPVTEQMKSRFRSADLQGQLAPEAAGLATVMGEAAASLRAHLDELDAHQRTAVTAMRGMVRGALKTLHRLQVASALPDTLPTWGGQRFLSIGPKRHVELTDAILDDRIGRVVDAMCTAGNEIPKGADLLWAATHAVVGDGNWAAKVLKPTVDGTIELSTVAQMRKWSGGEKVTANLLLFALAVKVRASERGRDHVGFGVLPLDNPLGKASYVPFLELQRKVAAEYGIQLLFLTGVADLRAVGRFPNIIRMANRSSGGRRYVGVIGREVEPATVGLLSHARIIRPDPIPGL